MRKEAIIDIYVDSDNNEIDVDFIANTSKLLPTRHLGTWIFAKNVSKDDIKQIFDILIKYVN